MERNNLLGVIVVTLIVNAGFIYVSYLTYHIFKLSILHIIFAIMPFTIYFNNLKSKI